MGTTSRPDAFVKWFDQRKAVSHLTCDELGWMSLVVPSDNWYICVDGTTDRPCLDAAVHALADTATWEKMQQAVDHWCTVGSMIRSICTAEASSDAAQSLLQKRRRSKNCFVVGLTILAWNRTCADITGGTAIHHGDIGANVLAELARRNYVALTGDKIRLTALGQAAYDATARAPHALNSLHEVPFEPFPDTFDFFVSD